MFVQGSDTTTVVEGDTDAEGDISLTFVAGFVSGGIDLIASTEYNGDTYQDTLRLTVQVPGLLPMDIDPEILANALLIGSTPEHPSDTWNATPQFAAAARAMVIGERRTIGAQTYYVQLNDASLPLGGAFTVEPPQNAIGVGIEQPGRGHRTHTSGVEEDLAWCYALTNGATGNRIGGIDCSGQGTLPVDPTLLEQYGFVVLVERGDAPHYHIRLEDQ
jgi:hypothetical protein